MFHSQSIGAVLDPRLALAPSLSCEKLNSFMTGIIVVSIGIPVLLIIILIVKHRQLSTVAKAKVRFGALTGISVSIFISIFKMSRWLSR